MPSSAMAPPSKPRPLRSHLETFPQELYDYVYDLTFTAEPGVRYVSKPPEGAPKEGRKSRPAYIKPDHVGLLHVDRLSRDKFARSYYGGEGASFVFEVIGRVGTLSPYMTPWTSSVDLKHLSLIKDVRGVFAKCDMSFSERMDRSQYVWNPITDNDKLHTKLFLAAAAFGYDAAVTLRCGDEGVVTADLEGYQNFAAYGIELPFIG